MGWEVQPRSPAQDIRTSLVEHSSANCPQTTYPQRPVVLRSSRCRERRRCEFANRQRRRVTNRPCPKGSRFVVRKEVMPPLLRAFTAAASRCVINPHAALLKVVLTVCLSCRNAALICPAAHACIMGSSVR